MLFGKEPKSLLRRGLCPLIRCVKGHGVNLALPPWPLNFVSATAKIGSPLSSFLSSHTLSFSPSSLLLGFYQLATLTGRAPELCGWALWLGLVLLLAAPELYQLCGRALWLGLVLLLSSSWPALWLGLVLLLSPSSLRP